MVTPPFVFVGREKYCLTVWWCKAEYVAVSGSDAEVPVNNPSNIVQLFTSCYLKQ